MKKHLLAIMCALVMLFAFTACSGDKYADSPYLGTWTATSAEMMGIELPVADVIGGDMTIVFEANGSCTLDAAGDASSGSWEETETGVSIDDGDVELTIDGDSATLVQDDVTINFEREASE